MSWTKILEVAKDFIVPLAGTVTGAWATFAVFKRQLEESRRSHEETLARSIREDTERQDQLAEKNLTHFVWLLEEVVKYATKQNADYLITSSAVEKNPLSQHSFTVRASEVLSRILTLKQDDIFFSLIRKALDTAQNRSRIAVVYNKLDYISSTIDEVRLSYKYHLKTYNNIVAEYREIIENIRDLISEVNTQSRKAKTFENDELARFLSSAQNHYLTSLSNIPEASGVEWHQENYLEPLMQYLIDNFIDDERAYQILTTARRANILVGRVKHSSADAVHIFNRSNAALATALNELQVEVDYIKAVLLTT